MAKFYGKIGFCMPIEGNGSYEGIVSERVVERPYYGDVLRNNPKWDKGTDINDNLSLSNRFSVVGDSFLYKHSYAMKYVSWMGALWKITNVEIQRPRLILTVGDVYNGPTPGSTSVIS